MILFATESTCSHDSCYGCITNSESSDEFQMDSKPDLKHSDTTVAITVASHLKTGIRECSKNSTSPKVLKVSQFSKSLHEYTDFESKKSEKKYENMETRAIKSQSKAERHEKQSESSRKSSKSPQILRVVDVVPKPKLPQTVLDQTIGIPVKNLSHYRNCSNSYNFSQTLPDLQERLLFSDVLSNDTRNEPQVIHHPLVSGNIPATFKHVHESHKKMYTKSLPHEINAHQQSSSTKRENGERNKVKFCNTVTVAVVPVSF